MKNRLVCIFILMLLFTAATFSVSGYENNEKDRKNSSDILVEFAIIFGEVNDYIEEIIEDETYYTFFFTGTVISFQYRPLLDIDYYKGPAEDLEIMLPKINFKGYINEDYIIGIYINIVEL